MLKRISYLFLILALACSKETINYSLVVNVNPPEGGFVNPDGGTVPAGEQISLLATPADEYLFDGWSGAETGTSPSISIIMDANKSVTANFIKKQYNLTLKVDGEGEIIKEVIKQGITTDYNSGTIIKLTAKPADEWEFAEWQGAISGKENPKEITMTEDKTVTAIFRKRIAYPEVRTGGINRTGSFYAIINNNYIKSDGGGTISRFGICWSSQENPTINDNVVEGTKDDSYNTYYSAEIQELKSNSKYYFTAFVENERGISYGETQYFTTNYSYSDKEGNEYGAIKLREYLFLDQNFNSEYYSNGDKILKVNNLDEAKEANTNKTGAWCYYNFDENNSYMGKIYNWYAVNDDRGLGDDKWSVPSDDELKVSFDKYAGFDNPYRPGDGEYAWGGKSIDLKKDGKSGFNAEATGYHMYNTVQSKERLFYFWSKTKYVYQYDTSLNLAFVRGIMFEDYRTYQNKILYTYTEADGFISIRLSRKID